MKKFLNYFLLASVVTIFVVSCKPDDDPYYEGDNFISFANTSSQATVVKGSTSREVTVMYTTLSAAMANTEVKISVDPSQSSAIEGTDFKIINATDNLAAGQKVGYFRIQLLESGAKETQKVIAFKISSPTVPNSDFNQIHKLSYSLECLFNMSGFTGTYKVVTDTWADYEAGDLIPVQLGPGANQFKILASNNPYISNFNTAYMLVTVQTNGSVTLTSNEPFNYGGSTGTLAMAGTGTVNFCTNEINISTLNLSGAAGSSNGNKFVIVKN